MKILPGFPFIRKQRLCDFEGIVFTANAEINGAYPDCYFDGRDMGAGKDM